MSHLTDLGYTAYGFVVAIVLVMTFHELGHFLVGRWCGVKVESFSIGVGPELFARVDRHGTRWRVAALPFAGYVKFLEEADLVRAGGAASTQTAAERAKTLDAQPVWERAAIYAGGPIASFLLALVILTGVFYSEGRVVLLPRIASVQADSAAAKAGFVAGDVVRSIDGRPIRSFVDMQKIVSTSSGVSLAFGVDRGGRTMMLTATPQQRDVDGPVGRASIGVLGVGASNDPSDQLHERLGIGDAIENAVGQTWSVIDITAGYVGDLVIGRGKPDQLSGPIGIAHIAGQVAKVGISPLFNLIALLSISVGVINLVPIPPLDGGRLLYCAFEALRGRPLSLGVQGFGLGVGLAIVAMLMIFTTYNDIAHIAHG